MLALHLLAIDCHKGWYGRVYLLSKYGRGAYIFRHTQHRPALAAHMQCLATDIGVSQYHALYLEIGINGLALVRLARLAQLKKGLDGAILSASAADSPSEHLKHRIM
jgi:hypothetical protein